MDILFVGFEQDTIDTVSNSFSNNVIRNFRPLDAAFKAWDEMEKWKGFNNEKEILEFDLTRYMLKLINRENTVVASHILEGDTALSFLAFVKRFFPDCQIIAVSRNLYDTAKIMRKTPYGGDRTDYREHCRALRVCLKECEHIASALITFFKKAKPENKWFHEEGFDKIAEIIDVKGKVPELPKVEKLSPEEEEIIHSRLKHYEDLCN